MIDSSTRASVRSASAWRLASRYSRPARWLASVRALRRNAIERQRHAIDDKAPVDDTPAELIGASEEFGDERGLRIGVDLLRCPHLFDAAIVHHYLQRDRAPLQ